MLGVFWRLVVGRFGCDHKWWIIEQRTVNTSNGERFQRYILQCGKCGDVAKRDME